MCAPDKKLNFTCVSEEIDYDTVNIGNGHIHQTSSDTHVEALELPDTHEYMSHSSTNNQHIDVLSHCTHFIHDNSDIHDSMQPCYCMLQNPKINCHTDVHLLAHKFHFPRKFVSHDLEDNRSNSQIMKDIIMILTGFYTKEFKSIVDNVISRDASHKVINDGIYTTHSQMKSIVKQWKKLHNNKDNLDNLPTVAVTDPSHPYHSLALEHTMPNPNKTQEPSPSVSSTSPVASSAPNQSSPSPVSIFLNLDKDHLHTLPMLEVKLSTLDNSMATASTFVIDSGSSHAALGINHLQQLKINQNNLKNKNKYILNTTTVSNDNTSIIGSVTLLLHFKDVKGQFYPVKINFIVLNNRLNQPLLDIHTLRSLNYSLGFNNNSETLHLTFPNHKIPIQIQLKSPTLNPTRIYSHYTNLTSPNTGNNDHVNNNHNIDTNDIDMDDLVLSNTTLEDVVFDKNKFVKEHPPNQDFLAPNFENCTPEEVETLTQLFKQYNTVFSKNKFDCGKYDGFKVDIQTEPGKIVQQRPRKLNEKQLQAADSLINGLLENNILKKAPTDCPWSSNYLVIPKETIRSKSRADKYLQKQNVLPTTDHTTWRLTGDYRALNEISTSLPTPNYPSYDEIHLKLKGKYAFQFDLSNNFFHMVLTDSSALKTTFFHRQERYYLLRCPQGFKNSSFHAGLMLNDVFGRNTVNKFKETILPSFDTDKFLNRLVNFSDDYCICADTRYELMDFIHCVLFCLKTHNMKISLYKMRFFMENFKFLNNEYNLKNSKIAIDEKRIQAIKSWVSPDSLAMVASRLACLQYLSPWIPNFKLIALPFFIMLRDQTFTWSLQHQKWYNNLKYLIALQIQLTLPDPSKHLFCTSDASQVGSSSCIMQFCPKSKCFELIGLNSKIFSKQLAMRHILHRELTALSYMLKTYEDLIQSNHNIVTIGVDIIVMIYAGSNKSHNTSLYNTSLLLSSIPNIQVISLASEANVLADIISKAFSFRAKKHSIAKDLAQKVTNKFTTDTKIYSHEDLMTFLFSEDDTYIDCNEGIEHYSPSKVQLPIQSLQILFEHPAELEFLRCSSMDIEKITKCHSLWQRLSGKKKLNYTDLNKIVKKYKLSEAQLSIYTLFTAIKDAEFHIDTCLKLFPLEARFFVQETIKLLKVTKANKKLMKELSQWDTLSPANQKQLLTKAETFVTAHYGSSLQDSSNFQGLIPLVINDSESEIMAQPGTNCINIHLQKDLVLKKGELKKLKLNFLCMYNTEFIYFTAASQIKQIIFNLPTSHYVGHHHFSSTYLFTDKKVTLKASEPIFCLQGFKNRVTTYRTVPPITLKCDEQRCFEDSTTEIRIQVVSFIPILLDPQPYMKIFEQYKQYQNKMTPIFDLCSLHYSYLVLKQEEQNKIHLFSLQSELQAGSSTDLDQKPSRYNKYTPLEMQQSLNNLIFIQNLLKLDVDKKFLLKLFLKDTFYLQLYEATLNKKQDQFTISESFIFKQNKCQITNNKYLTLVVPVDVAKLILNFYHDQLHNHTSKHQLALIFSRMFYCQNLPSVAKQITDQCLACNLSKTVKIHKSSGQIRSIQPLKPHEHLVLDISQSLPRTKHNNCHLMVACCDLTGYVMAVPIPNLLSDTCMHAIAMVFQYLGAPRIITTDLSSAWMSSFSAYLSKMNIIHYKMEAKSSPQAGLAEVHIKLFRNHITRAILNPMGLMRDDWDLKLPTILLGFNLQAPYSLSLSRQQLYFGAHHHYNYASRFLSFNEEDEMTNKFIQQLRTKRAELNRNKNVHSGIRKGMYVQKLIRNADMPIQNDSKYLFPSSPQTFLVLDITCHTAYVKCLNNGNVSTCSLSELRPLTYKQLDSLQISPTPLTSIFETTRFHKGSQPEFLADNQTSYHSKNMSQQLKKHILEIIDEHHNVTDNDNVSTIDNPSGIVSVPNDGNVPQNINCKTDTNDTTTQADTLSTKHSSQGIAKSPTTMDSKNSKPPQPETTKPTKPIIKRKLTLPNKNITDDITTTTNDMDTDIDVLVENLQPLPTYQPVIDEVSHERKQKKVSFHDDVTVSFVNNLKKRQKIQLNYSMTAQTTQHIPVYLPFDMSLRELDLVLNKQLINCIQD